MKKTTVRMLVGISIFAMMISPLAIAANSSDAAATTEPGLRMGEFRIVPYGMLWGSAIYETERTVPGAYALYVNSSDTEGEDSFVIDTRRTRIGLNVFGPDVDFLFLNDLHAMGKIEVDLHGAFVVENKPGVLFRHAYADLWNDTYRILAGQTWDIISPLYPHMLSYSVGWGGGNMGYRRAQMRAERYVNFSDSCKLSLQGSLNQNIVSDFNSTAGVQPESSNWPLLEGRIGFTLGERGKGHDPAVIGFSGHLGEQGFDFVSPSDPVADDERIETWSGNVDLHLPITKNFGLNAEAFAGENLGTFLGGIVQGVDLTRREGIYSEGGWAELWYKWTPRLRSYAGYGFDDPRDEDVSTGRIHNSFLFGNLSFDITKHLNIGLEVALWETEFQAAGDDVDDPEPGESVRFEFAGRYGF